MLVQLQDKEDYEPSTEYKFKVKKKLQRMILTIMQIYILIELNQGSKGKFSVGPAENQGCQD